MPDFDLETLPSEKDNYDVWCERCQRVHRYFTYTREDHERVIAQAVQNLSDAIDQRVFDEMMRDMGRKH